MPQDLLQIAQEHHRAGRLRRAEEIYCDLLESDPDNPEAAHWLGVLMFQAGRATDAVPLLQQAASARPDDPAFAHNLGQAYLAAGQMPDALREFNRALVLQPGRAETLFCSGVALLARKSPGDAEVAIMLLKEAQVGGLDTAEVHQYRGIALLMSDKIDDAIAACRTAIEKKSDYADAHYHLGVAYRHKGNIEDARRSLARAVDLSPTSVRAMQGLAVLEAETGRLAEAESLLRKVIALAPNSASAHQGLGMILQKMGRQNEASLAFMQGVRANHTTTEPPATSTSSSAAIAELEQKLTPSAEEASLHFRIAKQSNIAPPAKVPASSVSGLFDRYADLFDEHLRGKLDYRAPELIADAVAATKPAGPLDILDLGCGTGLCGPLLRPMAATLTGVDLSPAMIDKARERGVYDRLEAADIIDFLQRSPHSFDLLVAADVLMYLGDLSPTFEAAIAALRPGGLFAFSIEAGTGDRYQFQKETHRFTHAKTYVQHLAKIYGFRDESFSETAVRREGGKPVSAYLFVLRA